MTNFVDQWGKVVSIELSCQGVPQEGAYMRICNLECTAIMGVNGPVYRVKSIDATIRKAYDILCNEENSINEIYIKEL